MKIVEKDWGYEKFIVNGENGNYCGKILHFDKGKSCSWHFHKIKAETFYVQSGRVLLRVGYGELEDAVEHMLGPGEKFDIPIGLRHKVTALEDSDVFEFSTQHYDEDSHRISR